MQHKILLFFLVCTVCTGTGTGTYVLLSDTNTFLRGHTYVVSSAISQSSFLERTFVPTYRINILLICWGEKFQQISSFLLITWTIKCVGNCTSRDSTATRCLSLWFFFLLLDRRKQLTVGRNSQCLFMWSDRWSLLEKDLEQRWQQKGFCPVCFLKCLVSSSDLANFQSHPSHVHS